MNKTTQTRPIKFRGLKLDRSEWVYGLLTYHFAHDGKKWNRYLSIQQDSGGADILIIPETVGQLVMIVNKKEVYEGDVQRWLNPCKSKTEYEKDPYSYMIVFYDIKLEGFNIYHDGEVVGNIWQNPELLKN